MRVLKTLLLGLLAFVASADLMGQESTTVDPTISALIEHERRIEQSVVAGDVAALDTVYSADFQFTHGDGNIQTKTEWLATVEQAKASDVFRSRLLRDQVGELHGDVAIIEGWIDVRANREYSVRYVRVYQMRAGRWLMLSHRTVQGG